MIDGWQHVLAWVRTHGLKPDAVFLLKYVAKQKGLPPDVARLILMWCKDFATDPDAIWRLSTLIHNIGPDLAEQALQASESVLEPILTKPNLKFVTRSQVSTILGDLTDFEPLRTGPAKDGLLNLLLRWVNHPQSFAGTRFHAPHNQKRAFISMLV